MAKQRGARKKEESNRLVPILFRVSRAEHELAKKRASILGMNVSAFLRLPIRKGRIELDEPVR